MLSTSPRSCFLVFFIRTAACAPLCLLYCWSATYVHHHPIHVPFFHHHVSLLFLYDLLTINDLLAYVIVSILTLRVVHIDYLSRLVLYTFVLGRFGGCFRGQLRFWACEFLEMCFALLFEADQCVDDLVLIF